MLVLIVTAFIILLISLAGEVICSTTAKDPVRYDYDYDMSKELLQRMDKMQTHIDRIERHVDKMETHMDKMQTHMDKIPGDMDEMRRHVDQMEKNIHTGFGQLENDNKNLSVVMETIVEQQMVITAEIFTVSQTLPFCCCHYQDTTEPEKPDTTTATPLKSLPRNCAEAMGESGSDGVYKVNITNSDIGSFDVYCMKNDAKLLEEETINGTWLIIQRRQDNTTDFYLDWSAYQRGFGDLDGNFWIGLDKLHALTNSSEQELWVELIGHDDEKVWAKYGQFGIANKNSLYNLKTLGHYKGTAGDSLSYHRDHYWSTFDKDNDAAVDLNCAILCKSGWWFNHCSQSHLNSIYGNTGSSGIMWFSFRLDKYPLKYVHMAIRPRI